ncbi:hypothetical protein AZE42_07655 [Rhizopogon vesiculosus]|uniref:Methyltransferase type 11 domain-containing protein n=1 Tax=Rhizopogon vesiculosus TaxID=180088 RepID=A0A1J8PRG0_9AGAM|nr:hypothetical protein AZE42_07655 [Rhizopogon vesiculosus]
MATNVHATAQSGFGAGTNELYDRARPSYPTESLSYIRRISKSIAPLNIVEIGAGTGIFTRALLSHPEWTTSIGALRAVDPSDDMRNFWTKTVKDNRTSIIKGTFDDTGVEDGWADLIIIAEAFHWCLDYAKAFTEFARILNKDGTFVLLWNNEDREAAGWVAQVFARIEVHKNGTPNLYIDLLRKTFSAPEYSSLFHPHEEKECLYRPVATDQIVTDRALSWSYITQLPLDDKVNLMEDIKSILERGDGKTWINEEEGTYQYPYETLVVMCRKK